VGRVGCRIPPVMPGATVPPHLPPALGDETELDSNSFRNVAGALALSVEPKGVAAARVKPLALHGGTDAISAALTGT
jgi:hypothetical protein